MDPEQELKLDQAIDALQKGQAPNLEGMNQDTIELLLLAKNIKAADVRYPKEKTMKESQKSKVSARLVSWLKSPSQPVWAAIAAVVIVALGFGTYSLGAHNSGSNNSSNGSTAGIFVPSIGSNNSNSGGSGSSANGASPNTNSTSGSNIAANPKAANSASTSNGASYYPYPYNNYCAPSSTNRVDNNNNSITVTGYAQILLPTTQEVYGLNLTVTTSSNDNVANLQDKANKIGTALQGVGVDKNHINVSYNINSSFNVETTPSKIQQDSSATITAQTFSVNDMNAALKAGFDAGATSGQASNGYSNGNNVSQPSSQDMSSAISKASANAKALAQASADASNLKLGKVNRVQVEPPIDCGNNSGSNNEQIMIVVTQNYATS